MLMVMVLVLVLVPMAITFLDGRTDVEERSKNDLKERTMDCSGQAQTFLTGVLTIRPVAEGSKGGDEDLGP